MITIPTTSRTRTGFPESCPIAYAAPVLARNCQGCDHYHRDPRGYWLCNYPDYQNAPGVHFCLTCDIELGPYAESHGWTFCGGPTARCLRE